MAEAKLKPTPALRQNIVAYIRAGGYSTVAAEAAGIPKKLFREWLRRGRQRRAGPAYRDLVREVRQAMAQARLAAELAAFKTKPLDWLKFGPGKETRGNPGWTGTVKAGNPAAGQANALLQAEVQGLIRTLLELLAPFPQARAVVATALEQQPLLAEPPPEDAAPTVS
jgi:hypothetical protein